MARTEARIFTSIWKDEDFLALPPSAQRLYMFLLSQPELTYCGTLPLRERRWASKAAGLTLADIERDLKELEGSANPSANPHSRQPFVIADPDTGELFIRSLLRRDNAWKQPNLLKQAMDSADEIESPRIRGALLCEVQRLPVEESPSSQVKTLVARFQNDLAQGRLHPSAYPADNPSPVPSDDPSGDPSDKARARACIPLTPISSAPTTSVAAPPARDRKLGTRLPDDFTVTAEMKTWFAEHCRHVNGQREHDKFCDYWRAKPGKDGRKLDWVMTWRNWMRTAEDRAMPRPRAITSRQQETNELFDRAARRIEAREATS